MPFFARSSHNNKVSNKTEKDDDDVDTESESFHILKRQQAVEQTYVFCLHVFDTMHNLALSSCENSETNGKSSAVVSRLLGNTKQSSIALHSFGQIIR